MPLLNQIVDPVLTWLLTALVAFVLADSVVLCLVRKHKPLIENSYYQFHKKNGFFIVSTGKLSGAVLVAYFLLEPSANAGKLAAPVLAYGFMIAKLLHDLLSKNG